MQNRRSWLSTSSDLRELPFPGRGILIPSLLKPFIGVRYRKPVMRYPFSSHNRAFGLAKIAIAKSDEVTIDHRP